ncbi:MAG: hypothetical protein OHK0017_09390 [Patescibacteria group bacterium]
MFFPFIILGLIVAIIWQAVLKLEKFVIDVHHKHRLVFGLCASLADKYKSNVWVVRLGMLFIVNVGYLVMYLLLDKTENQGPSNQIKSSDIKFNKKNSSSQNINIEVE